MRKALILLLSAGSLLCSPAVLGQNIMVSDPRLEMRDNTIHITYDILNSTPSEEFTVDLIVKDEDGNVIKATALTGDVGDMVTGGRNKHIAWDLEVDRIEINADIYVKVYVKAVPPPEPVVVPPDEREANRGDEEREVSLEESVQEKDAREGPSSTRSGKQFSRTGIILQSVAFPGLGLSRYKGGPHWIKGVLGYGCIAGSIIMNQAAINTYEGIIDQAGYEAKNTVYQKSHQQDQISEVLAYATVAIWISDLIWTFVGTSDLNKGISHHKGLRINSTFDPVSNSPLFAFTYRF